MPSTRRSKRGAADDDSTPVPATDRRASLPTSAMRSATPHKPTREMERRQLGHLNDRLEAYVSMTKNLRKEREELATHLATQEQKHDAELAALEQSHAARLTELQTYLSSAVGRADSAEEKLNELLPQLEAAVAAADAAQRTADEARAQARAADDKAKNLAVDLQDAKTRAQKAAADGAANLAKARAAAAQELERARADWEDLHRQKLAALEAELQEVYGDELEDLRERLEQAKQQQERTLTRLNEAQAAAAAAGARASRAEGALLGQMKESAARDDEARHQISSLMDQIADLSAARDTLKHEFDDLMDTRIKLDAEIDHYRAILELEEERYGMPSPPTASLLNRNSSTSGLRALPGRSNRAAAAIEAASAASEDEESGAGSSDEEQAHVATSAAAAITTAGQKRSRQADVSSTAQQTATSTTSVGATKRTKLEISDEDNAFVSTAQVLPAISLDDGDDWDANDYDYEPESTTQEPETKSTSGGTRRRSRSRSHGRAREPHKPLLRDEGSPRTANQSPFADRVNMQLDLLADSVVVKNHTDEPLDLGGWTVRSTIGVQKFVFPATFLVPPGKSATVWSGPEAAQHAEGDEFALVWSRRYIWNNRGDEAILYDEEANEVAKVRCTAMDYCKSSTGQLIRNVATETSAGTGAEGVATGSQPADGQCCVM